MTTCLLQNKPFYCREWVFTKLLHCLDSRTTAKTCGTLVMGGPGSGKTAVSCELVWPTGNNTRAACLSQRLLAYYFCQAHDVETLSVANFIQCITQQVMKCPLLTGFTCNVDISQCHRDPDVAFRDGFLTPLLNIAPPSQNLFLLVDSVDESYLQCGTVSTSGTIAELLARNQALCPPWLLLVCTVRRQSRSVARLFTGFRKVAIDDLRKAHVVRDVQQYILCRLDRDDRLRLHLSRETAEILNQLHIKCNGCFLYLEKVLDGVVDNFILLREIREIPGTLNGLYLWLCQRLFVGRQFTVVEPILNVMLAARRPLTDVELYSCAVTRCLSLTFTEFQRRIELLSKLLVEGRDATRILFHHSFAEWLLDVKHCTPHFLCTPAEGHAMLALSFTPHAAQLTATELHDYALHVSRCALFTDSFHSVLWLTLSAANIDQCLQSVELPSDTAVIRLLVAAGAQPPVSWCSTLPTVETCRQTSVNSAVTDELDSECQTMLLAASPSAVSVLSEPVDGCLASQTALGLAARRGDIDTVSAILAAGTDVDSVDVDGWTALRSAAWGGHTAIVAALLAANACVDKADSDGRTALRAAAWAGHVAVVEMLLAAGANVNGVDNEGRTSLIAAAYMAHCDVVECLIAAGSDVDSADTDGRTALTVAVLGPHDAQQRRAQVVSLLVESGAQVDHRDRDLMTPLLVAAYEGHADLCELLLDAGADVDATDAVGRTALQAAVTSAAGSVVALLLFWGAAVDVIDTEGRTVLGIASQMGDARIVRQLLDRGLDELHRDNAGWTPLHIAAFEGHTEVVEALLEAGARVTEVDNDGRVPLVLAAQESHLCVVRCLIEASTPVDSRGHDGRTALRAAAAAADNCLEMMQYLVSCGADVNARDADGRTALYTVALDGRIEAGRWLLSVGADVQLCDSDGRNALHAAAWHGHRDFVLLLLDCGVDVDICDIEGRTPLQSASWQGHTAVVTLLLERGAAVDKVCSQGATALCVAAQEGHEGVVRALLSAGADPLRADRCGRTPSRLAARGAHLNIVRLLKEHSNSCVHNGCSNARPVANGNQSSSVADSRVVSNSTNQSSSSSGAGTTDVVQNMSFTQQLQQCSSGRQATRGKQPAVVAPGGVSTGDEMIIESVWQRRLERPRQGSSSVCRPGAMVMGRTALVMNSPESRGGAATKRHTNNNNNNSNAVITNPGYTPTTPDVTLCAPSRTTTTTTDNLTSDETSNNKSTTTAAAGVARPSGLALKRETPL